MYFLVTNADRRGSYPRHIAGMSKMIVSKQTVFSSQDLRLISIYCSMLLLTPLVVMFLASAISSL